jgi:hypothetical protein
MKKTLLFLISIFCLVNACNGRDDADVRKIINNLLGPTDFWYVHKSYRTFFIVINSNDIKTLQKSETIASDLLYKALDDPEKAVMAHIVLTLMFEPDKNYYLPNLEINSCFYILKNPVSRVGWYYIFNNLAWEGEPNSGNLQKDQIERIKHLWYLRLHGHYDAFEADPDELIREMHRRDCQKYGCHDNKNYQNNSIGVNIWDLQSLIGTKYPNPLFSKVLDILGNDSSEVRGQHNLYSIDFIADGINFVFDENQILERIFLRANYNGVLFNGIKMSDCRAEIISKAGNPEEYINVPRYSYDWIYNNLGMVMAFGLSDRIIDLQLFKKYSRDFFPPSR